MRRQPVADGEPDVILLPAHNREPERPGVEALELFDHPLRLGSGRPTGGYTRRVPLVLHQRFRATPERVLRARRAVRDALAPFDLPRDSRAERSPWRVTEAVTNAVLYAYPNDRAGTVARRERAQLRVGQARDEQTERPCRTAPPTGGRQGRRVNPHPVWRQPVRVRSSSARRRSAM